MFGEGKRKTIVRLSMRCFGFFAQGLLGAICRPIMGIGKIRTGDWRHRGEWEALLEKLVREPDFEWLMIDATPIKVHVHAAGARGGNQDMGRTRGQHETT